MTNIEITALPGVKRASQNARTVNTLRLVHLMEEQQRLEIAERIRQLRERSPWTQPVVADRLGLTLRGYQKLEERGTTRYERAEEIAKVHIDWAAGDSEWAPRAAAMWIWDGRESTPAPDPFEGDLSVQVVELSEAVQALRSELRATRTELLAEIGKARTAQGARSATPARGRRKKESTGT